MANEFTFGAGGERISVRIEEPKRSVSVNLGAFSGSFKAEFALQDLVLLHERLITAFGSPSETVRFANKEEDVSLTIEVNGHGGAIITGTIQPHRLKPSFPNTHSRLQECWFSGMAASPGAPIVWRSREDGDAGRAWNCSDGARNVRTVRMAIIARSSGSAVCRGPRAHRRAILANSQGNLNRLGNNRRNRWQPLKRARSANILRAHVP